MPQTRHHTDKIINITKKVNQEYLISYKLFRVGYEVLESSVKIIAGEEKNLS
jgi:uncharacterized protein YjaG (DUF416 family)